MTLLELTDEYCLVTCWPCGANNRKPVVAEAVFTRNSRFGWNDIGDWSVIYSLAKKDKHSNAAISYSSNGGGHISLDSKNNLIQFDDQLIATVGVENLIIVDTGDAVLICNKDKAENVKELVSLLKEKNLTHFI